MAHDRCVTLTRRPGPAALCTDCARCQARMHSNSDFLFIFAISDVNIAQILKIFKLLLHQTYSHHPTNFDDRAICSFQMNPE